MLPTPRGRRAPQGTVPARQPGYRNSRHHHRRLLDDELRQDLASAFRINELELCSKTIGRCSSERLRLAPEMNARLSDRFHDALDLLHVVDVERADAIAAAGGLVQQLAH
jgi:hypothetical protein